jgi:hypothetical protein
MEGLDARTQYLSNQAVLLFAGHNFFAHNAKRLVLPWTPNLLQGVPLMIFNA